MTLQYLDEERLTIIEYNDKKGTSMDVRRIYMGRTLEQKVIVSEKTYEEIVSILKEINTTCQNVLKMDWIAKERMVLNVLIITANEKILSSLKVKVACEEVLSLYPKGTYPHDQTLLDEVRDRLETVEEKQYLTIDSFTMEVMTFKIMGIAVAESFSKLEGFELPQNEQYIIEVLKKSVDGIYKTNPNFLGDNPYYKRHHNELQHSKKLWVELLDKDFSNFIHYFSGE